MKNILIKEVIKKFLLFSVGNNKDDIEFTEGDKIKRLTERIINKYT